MLDQFHPCIHDSIVNIVDGAARALSNIFWDNFIHDYHLYALYGLSILIRYTDCQFVCLIWIPNPPPWMHIKSDKEEQGHLWQWWTMTRRLWWRPLVVRWQHERWRQWCNGEQTQTEGEERHEYCSRGKEKKENAFKK